MAIQKGSQVSLHYRLYFDGFGEELVEETEENNPLEFIVGSGEMLALFEEAIMGKDSGDQFEIFIPCNQAYGPDDEDAYIELDKSEFIGDDGEWDEELLEVGEVVPMLTEDGEEVYGVITEVKLNSVVVDFNHPLAGEDLYFKGVIVSVE
jgi:FKBP-type peptidyl-prolyl cis-trans isomerase SlyD